MALNIPAGPATNANTTPDSRLNKVPPIPATVAPKPHVPFVKLVVLLQKSSIHVFTEQVSGALVPE